MSTYIVLHGAKKNIGDFLIHERGKQLLKHLKKDAEIVDLPSWKPLDEHLDTINKADAVIIPGGPGAQPGMYPGIYPLVDHLDRIKPPIFSLGIGWHSFPGDEVNLQRLRFSAQSHQLLSKMGGVGVRDYHTEYVLRNNGVERVSMNGCPVWYHVPSLGSSFRIPETVKSLVFTPAQNEMYRDQNKAMIRMLREVLPEATLYCSFHRGITADKYTSQREAQHVADLIEVAKPLGYEIRDTSYDLKTLEFYQTADVHVGYRLHAHLEFISRRVPSFLLHEDGRGNGASFALGLPGIDAWRRGKMSWMVDRMPKLKVLNKRNIANFIAANPYAVMMMEQYLRQEMRYGFPRFKGIAARLDAQYAVMKAYVEALP